MAIENWQELTENEPPAGTLRGYDFEICGDRGTLITSKGREEAIEALRKKFGKEVMLVKGPKYPTV